MFYVIQPAHRGEFNEIGRVYVQALYSTVLEWTISISSWQNFLNKVEEKLKTILTEVYWGG